MNRVAVLRRKRFFQGLVEQGMKSGTAVVLQQSPHLTYYSAGETARRMLRDIEERPEFMEERDQIAELKELDEISSRRARDDKHQKADKYVELLYRRKGALIDKTEQTVQTISNEELDRMAAEKALELIKQAESVEVTKVSDNV